MKIVKNLKRFICWQTEHDWYFMYRCRDTDEAWNYKGRECKRCGYWEPVK